MGISMKFNSTQLEFNLNQIGDKAVKGMSERMRRHAINIRDLAREFAPVKTGLLEKSIDYAVLRQGRRNAYIVYIDTDAHRFKGEGTLGDYAMIMHQMLHPYGRQTVARRYNLGPLSKVKAASGKKVGGRFLIRAVKQANVSFMTDMVNEVRRVTGASSLGLTAPVRYNGGDFE